jgi:hypothetical protein
MALPRAAPKWLRLGDEELALYDAAVAQTLTPDAVHWLAEGGPLATATR